MLKYTVLLLLLASVAVAMPEHPVPVEVIQDDPSTYIVLNSWGDREEHYFDAEGNEIRTVIIDSAGNRFETEYDAAGKIIRESMPDELAGREVHATEQVRVETNEKGIEGVLHYDTKDRLTKITETFVFGYVGVSEYEYYEKQQLIERDGLRGYEWVVRREVSSLVKDGEVKASIIKEFDKRRKLTKRETSGLTVMFPVIALIAKVYGYEVSEEDIQTA